MMTMIVQSARATSLKDPLAIDAPWELYFLIVLVSVAVVAGWECMWGLWYYVTGQETPTEMRRAKRLRRMQEAVQQEIATQLGAEASSSTTSTAQARLEHATNTRPSPSTPTPGLATTPMTYEYGRLYAPRAYVVDGIIKGEDCLPGRSTGQGVPD